MKRKLWISGFLLAAALSCLAGCEKEESSEQEEKAPVDKKVEALVINTEEKNTDSQEAEKQEEPSQEAPSEENEEKEDEADKKEASPRILKDLGAQIEELVTPEQAKGTSVSVYAGELETGNYVSVGNKKQQSASLIKLFIAGCIYEHWDVPGSQEAYENETEELVHRMLSASDNDATNTLVTRLGSGDPAAGMALVNDYCAAHDFPDTHMGRLMLDFNASDDNYTSVDDCGHFLLAIYKKELTGSESILSHLKQQERTGKIPAGVPDGVETANKTGELADVENDAAIIFKDTGSYSLCVILNQLPDPDAGRTMITELSSMVYTYMGSR